MENSESPKDKIIILVLSKVLKQLEFFSSFNTVGTRHGLCGIISKICDSEKCDFNSVIGAINDTNNIRISKGQYYWYRDEIFYISNESWYIPRINAVKKTIKNLEGRKKYIIFV